MVAIDTLSVQMPPACAVMVASDGEKMLIFSSALKIVRVRDQNNAPPRCNELSGITIIDGNRQSYGPYACITSIPGSVVEK